MTHSPLGNNYLFGSLAMTSLKALYGLLSLAIHGEIDRGWCCGGEGLVLCVDRWFIRRYFTRRCLLYVFLPLVYRANNPRRWRNCCYWIWR